MSSLYFVDSSLLYFVALNLETKKPKHRHAWVLFYLEGKLAHMKTLGALDKANSP
jgi:hypothetical protein